MQQPSAVTPDATRSLRWAVYAILIALSLGHVTGRILAVNSLDLIGLDNFRAQEKVKKRKEELLAQGLPVDEAKLLQEARLEETRQRPFLSANDRSRWCTVRSLVEHGTYEIDAISNQ